MGRSQSAFVEMFRKSVCEALGENLSVTGSQIATNCLTLPAAELVRREGIPKRVERFELGDIRIEFDHLTAIVEYESDAIAIHNLVKYWPFIRGETTPSAGKPLLICHFSNWHSYGSHRDLWEWLGRCMRCDPQRKVDLFARQFDHGGQDADLRAKGIGQAIEWLRSMTEACRTQVAIPAP